jgi:sporulation protein YlmC with PRC-barrel domain
MKTTLATISAVLGLSALQVCAGYDGSDVADAAGALRANPAASDSSSQQAGVIVNSKKLNGLEVRNPAGEKLGKVQEMAIDLEAGRVVEVVLALGGVLGIGEKLVAIPPAALTLDREGKLRLDTDREHLKSSEEFDDSNWAQNFVPAQVSRAYREYGVETYFLDPSKPQGAVRPSAERIGHVERAGKLIGFTIKNRQGETVGKVDDLAIDLAAGRVSQVIVSGGLLGADKGLSFLPTELFRYNRDRSELELDAEKESLTWTPRTGSAVETGGGAESMPAETGRGVDVALTGKIRSVIHQAEGLSVNARNITVISRNGRVTLSGAVETDTERAALGQLASRYVVPENIDNRLAVNPVSMNR